MNRMARTGLTKSLIRACRDRLLAEGRYPFVDALRLRPPALKFL